MDALNDKVQGSSPVDISPEGISFVGLKQLALALQQQCLKRGLLAVSAESCTGGLIAATITEIPGSSGYFERSFVTYTNIAKQEMLGVRSETLAAVGAVSERTAKEMAAGALQHSHADLAVAVTGIAGPGGGSADKPVGTVWIAFCKKGELPQACCHHFAGSREQVRLQTVREALNGLFCCAIGQELLNYK